MALTGSRTYVGFGFGAIQAGLLLQEAFRSGAFRRLVVAEPVPEAVSALRAAGGRFRINIACATGIEQAEVGPIEIFNPHAEPDRGELIRAIAAAAEIGTAIPSVDLYASDGPGSLHRVLAAGLARKAASGEPRAVIYTAENNNRAAEILREKVLEALPEGERNAALEACRFLNTVIGKMSGVVADPGEIGQLRLAPVTPGGGRAFLVEAFNRILISRIGFDGPPFERGIAVFEEKEDLLPFEEAKLYGHNAIHALAAYTASARGVARIAELADLPGVLPFLRAAFIDEAGGALVSRHHGLDPLFTHDGFRRHAEDLLARMTNPYLRDTAERVGRDPRRKLAWDDRLIGAMRLALGCGLEPGRCGFGAAAALGVLDAAFPDSLWPAAAWLDPLWSPSRPAAGERERVLAQIEAGRRRLKIWRSSGFKDLELLFHRDWQ